MAGKITPVYIPKPMGAIGWDGTDFYALKVDVDGHLQVDALTAVTGLDDLLHALHSVNTDELVVRGEDQLFTYKDRLVQRFTGAISGANGYFDSGAVPAGEVWIITNVCAQDFTSATTAQRYEVNDGVTLYTFYSKVAAIAAAEFTYEATLVYLKAGDKIRVWFTGGIVANTIYLFLTGYIMTKE